MTDNPSIGGIIPDVTIEELHHDRAVITQHPVETGNRVSDHMFFNPATVEMRTRRRGPCRAAGPTVPSTVPTTGGGLRRTNTAAAGLFQPEQARNSRGKRPTAAGGGWSFYRTASPPRTITKRLKYQCGGRSRRHSACSSFGGFP
ncbi:phage baseplate protein [Roseiarcus sp.]|uniref:phage baseplate protein n=1 Tax=Roseiarcus sp. TaxID=1969460 RepID=UPI003F9A72C6